MNADLSAIGPGLALLGFIGIPAVVLGARHAWLDYWQGHCHACWIDAQRSGEPGAKNGAITSVILGHTCWRRGWTNKRTKRAAVVNAEGAN